MQRSWISYAARNLECLFSALRKQKFVTFLLGLARQYKVHQISLDNLRDEQGNTLLHCIAENFNGIFQMSVESGGTLTPLLYLLGMTNPAIINSENSRGETPLHIAASRANLFFVHSFLTHGANPNACDEDGYLPVDLCPHPKGVAPEIYCARRLAICNLLLSAENFYNIHKISNKNFSPLYKAILLGAVKAVEAQLKKGASVNESFIWNADENALLFCLHSYRNFPKKTDKGSVTQIALRLLEEKIDLYATDPNGKTALYLAAEENLSLVCKAILMKDYRLMHVKTNEEESILPLLKHQWKTILPLEMPGVF